ncbi:MAG: hypothetical protein HYW26_04255 [Candidatus Aenigmarchaeota archaeon]|nr:hypothetical protein [Candidatus Aenigmarchaeota archaeon]
MKSPEPQEVSLREQLGKVGLDSAARDGAFQLVKIYESSPPVPVISIQTTRVFGDIEPYTSSSRHLVFPYGNAVLKSEDENWKCIRQQTKTRPETLNEFHFAIGYSNRGLPVVRPICVIHAVEEDDFLLVEPKGFDLRLGMEYNLLSNLPATEEEARETLRALGRFFVALKRADRAYQPNVLYYERFPFEHLIRFGENGSYQVLVTDNPAFVQEDIDAPGGYLSDVIALFEGYKNKEVSEFALRALREGLEPEIIITSP